MKWLGLVVAVLLSVPPTSAYAQSTKLADFQGTWEGGREGEKSKHMLIFRPDSTTNWWRWTLSDSDRKARPEFYRWQSLIGDTIIIHQGTRGLKITLKDEQLILSAVESKDVWVFRRVDTPTSNP